jgi:hypothetical protein
VHFSSTWLVLFFIPLLQASENTAIKMTIQYKQPGLSNQHTIYLEADRKRMEYRNSFGQKPADGSVQPIYGPHLVSITRCDLGRVFELNLDTREYASAPYPHGSLTREQVEASGLHTPVKYVADKPTLRIEVTTTDTGERKQIFGYIARHVVTTRKETPLTGSRSEPRETVTDGWYTDSRDIDLNQQLSCGPRRAKDGTGYAYLAVGTPPWQKPEFVTIGQPERGFALTSVTTVADSYQSPDGTKQYSDSKFETKVTELEERPLDPALFEIPPGFKLVAEIERNPAAAFASQPKDLWQRFKTVMADIFGR